MRVLHVVESLDIGFGGLSKTVLDLRNEMRRAGHEVQVLSCEAFFEARNGPTRSFLNRILRFGASEKLSSAITESARRSDVLHVHGLWRMHNIYAARAAAVAGIPLVVSTHGMLSPEALSVSAPAKRAAWWAFQRQILNTADVIHVTSAQEERDVASRCSPRKIASIPHGFEFAKQEQHDLQREKNVMFLGRIHPIKNLELLVDVWKSLSGAPAAEGWQLLIAGEGDPDYVRELQRRAGATNSIKFLGAVVSPQKERLLATSSVLVLPSKSENFGLVILEALAQATPVICSVGTPWQEVVEQGCGLWVQPAVSDFKGALNRFLSLPTAERVSMGRRGQRWARATFSLEHTVAKMTTLYTQICSR